MINSSHDAAADAREAKRDDRRAEKRVEKHNLKKAHESFEQQLQVGRKNTDHNKKRETVKAKHVLETATSKKQSAVKQKKADSQSTRLVAKQGMQHSRIQQQSQAVQHKMAQAHQQLDADNRASEIDTKTAEQASENQSVERAEDQRALDNQRGQGMARTDADSGGGRQGGGQGSDSGGGEDGGPVVFQAQASSFSTTSGAAATQGATNTLPPEIIREIVDKVFLGKDAQGLKEFHIKFGDGTLAGSVLSIKANGGRISIKVQTHDKDTARLFKASEHELHQALENRGLYLSQLEVA